MQTITASEQKWLEQNGFTPTQNLYRSADRLVHLELTQSTREKRWEASIEVCIEHLEKYQTVGETPQDAIAALKNLVNLAAIGFAQRRCHSKLTKKY